MALVGTILIDKLKKDDPAEKAFQPWWDTTKNTLVYGLIILGIWKVDTISLFIHILSFRSRIE